jgi:hypothetical protein
MPAQTLAPAATGLLELIRRSADLVDLVISTEEDPQDDRDVDAAIDRLDSLSKRALQRETVEKIQRGEY